ncbi:MAG TPA: M36 family metallopeptidase [Chitinophagaceae bacterium]|nr:M36 family metallopeptidase [Chitinophagaceae bacterium]
MRKKPLLPVTVAILIISACFTQKLHAQKKFETQHISDLVAANASGIHMSEYDIQNSRISDAYYSNQSGVLLVYLQQTYKGIDVNNAMQVLAFKNDKLVSSTGSIITKIQSRVNNTDGIPSQEPANAVAAAARYLNLPIAESVTPLNYVQGASEVEFTNLGISTEDITANLLWVPVNDGQRLVLCWQVQIQPNKTPDHWLIRIDAATNAFVSKANLTVSCNWTKPAHRHTANCYEEQEYDSLDAAPRTVVFKDPAAINSAKYRVLPFPVEAPTFPGGTPTLVTNPWLLSPTNSPATTLKWNDDGASSFAISRGNNVYAQEDHDANNNTLGQPATSKTALPDLDFDYSPNFNGEPKDSLNLGFSLTNLFYWNNIMHDLSYQYGFDEVSGNFQQSNLGRGGAGNDYVIADGQDATGLDNSNFATPPDGQNPRMQMYLFDYASEKNFHVNSPTSDSGYKIDVEGQMSTNNSLAAKGPITGNVVLYNSSSGSDSACTVASNTSALNNNIALIWRGDCNFTVKVKNAQLAGAKAVIMVNNIAGAGVLIMGGTDNTITIPAVMISYEDGTTIKNILASGKTVNVTLRTHLMDGSLDAGVMCHEYTHGISNRLTGGPSETGCLENAEQMGEGWSDYFAIMAVTDWSKAKTTDGSNPRPIGTYVIDEPPTGPGIREYPYSTSMTIDPWTYDMLATQTSGGEVHLIGEIWCTTLWEMTWAIIQQDGIINTNLFNANNAGGNSVALKLVTEAMKLQRCGPGFIDGRDAILKADTLLYNGKYSCSIWKAFAKRGMGVYASEGSANSVTDQVADFTVPANAIVTKHVDKDSVAQSDILTYNIVAACKCADLSNLKIVDTLPSSVTYISGGAYNSANHTVTFNNINLGASQSASYSLKVKVNNGSYFVPALVFSDSVNSATIPASTWQNKSTTGTTWRVSNVRFKTGGYSYFAADSSMPTNEMLITKNAYSLKGVSTLSFWHLYNTEAGYDGGVVEISTDNGTTWTDLGPYIIQNGYNSSIDKNNGTILSGRAAFSGVSPGMINTQINLTTFAGKQAMFRFTFACDDINNGEGWYIDDIALTSQAAVYNSVRLFTNADSLENLADTISFIKNATLPVTWGSFTVQRQNNTALLNWETLQELNTDKFIVERSGDGINFYEIGSVKAAGNSAKASDYTFTDATPLQGKDYYRLKQLDKDGGFDYSAIRELDFSTAGQEVTISPNPAKDKISITIPGNTKSLKVYIVNNAGQRLKAWPMQGQYMQVNLPVLAAGVYYVQVDGEGISSRHKLVIE